jgi:hypothetical protein
LRKTGERSFRRAHRRIEDRGRIRSLLRRHLDAPNRRRRLRARGVERALAVSRHDSATARAIQEAVVDVSSKPLRDDAGVVVVRPSP